MPSYRNLSLSKLRLGCSIALIIAKEILSPYAAAVAHAAENATAVIEHNRAVKLGHITCIHY